MRSSSKAVRRQIFEREQPVVGRCACAQEEKRNQIRCFMSTVAGRMIYESPRASLSRRPHLSPQLPSSSLEQTAILQAIGHGFNVCVDAVPGSGKTTLALLIAKTNPDKRVLILTYNADLKKETKEKIKKYSLDNAEAHSFHAFLYRYYSPCINDEDLKRIVKSGAGPTRKINFDIVVVDECQDLDALKHKMLVKNVFRQNDAENARLVIVGDKAQCIYEVYGADERYLTYASEAFNVSPREWKKLPLHHSWRLSISVTNFINRVLLRENRLKSCKHVDQKVEYHIVDLLKSMDSGRTEVLDDVLGKYRDGDIMVLAATVQSNDPYHPVNRFSNELTYQKRKVAITKDYEENDDGPMDDKILICNFHKAKGLERKVVIVLGFDDGYFKFYDRQTSEEDRKEINNPFYVALTRASERLILLHHYKNGFLPFVDDAEMESMLMKEHCRCVGKRLTSCFFDEDEKPDVCTMSVRQIVKRISIVPELWERMKRLLASHATLKTFDTTVSFPPRYSDEGIARVNGVAIPLNARVKVTQSAALFQKYEASKFNFMNESVVQDCAKLTEEAAANGGFEKPEHLLKVATVLCCLEDGTSYLYEQIRDFEWLSAIQIEHATTRYLECLNELVGSTVEWERQTECSLDDKYCLKGSMDNALSRDSIVEVKFSHSPGDRKENEMADSEHILQLALYMMCEDARGDYPRRGGLLIDLNKGVWKLSLTQGQLEALKSIVVESLNYKRGVKSLSELRQEWKDLIGLDYGVFSKQNICSGYPLCLRKKLVIDHEVRKEYQGLDEAEKARIYHYFLKGKKEDPVTLRLLDEVESTRLHEQYDRFEAVITNRFIQYDEQDMIQKSHRIDRLREGENIVHENYVFVKPTICGGLGKYTCPNCRGDLEVGEATFCKEMCGFEASGSLFKGTTHYLFPDLREYVGF